MRAPRDAGDSDASSRLSTRAGPRRRISRHLEIQCEAMAGADGRGAGLQPPRGPRSPQTSEAGTIVDGVGQPGERFNSGNRKMLGRQDLTRPGDRIVVRIITKADGTVSLRERRIYHGHRLLSVERLR
jgi:hypothetical protein